MNAVRAGCLALLLVCPASPAVADDRAGLVVLVLEEQANEIWSTLPEDPQDARVTVQGGASGECVAEALRHAKGALAQGGGGRLALRSLSLPLPVPRSVAQDLSAGRASVAAIAPYVTADVRSDQSRQSLTETGCADAAAFYELRGHAGGDDPLSLSLLLEGECGCAQERSGARRVRFHIEGEAALEPGILERKNVLRWRAKAPRYSILAACGGCDDASTRRAAQP